MLFSVEQAFVGRDETRAPLKMPVWEAIQLAAGKALMWVKNITNFGRFCYLTIPCLGINITLILYEFFKRLIHALPGKLKNRCFCWFLAAIFVPLKGTQTQRLLTKLYKFGLQRVFPNISHMKYRTHLILGEAFCIFIFFYLLDSGLSVLNGLQFYFGFHDSENPQYSRSKLINSNTNLYLSISTWMSQY